MAKLIYPELSYQIVGCLFEVYKELGYGHREKIYCAALKDELSKEGLKFSKEVPIELFYKKRIIGKHFIDFIVEDKIVLEVKTGKFFKKDHLKQVIDYLKSANMKLGIIVNFSADGVKFYRVLNIN